MALACALLLTASVAAQQAAPQQGAQVRSLLVRGALYLRTQRLVEPPGENAFDIFNEALEIDPENGVARAGMREIADYLLDIAREAHTSGSTQQAFELVEKGLQAAPDHPGLLALKAELDAARQAIARQARIDELLVQAGRHFQASRLTRPAGDNAYASYLQVLVLDPENEAAEEGLQLIAAHYLELASIREKQGQHRKSLAYIRSGLNVISDHEGLLALRDEVESALQQEQSKHDVNSKRAREIDALLASAAAQVQAGRVTRPPGDNAAETYNRVLKLAPDNAQARDGLDSLLVSAQNALLEKLDRYRTIDRELEREEESLRTRTHNALVTGWQRSGKKAVGE